MSNGIVIRTCTLCDRQYLGGTYREHAAVHVPVRKSNSGPGQTAPRAEVRELLAQGMTQSQVARTVGLSRQRVNQLVKEGVAS